MRSRWVNPKLWRSRRPASITVALVVSLTVLLGVLALVLDWAYVNMAHVELSRATDAASLAAAHALADEDQLRGISNLEKTCNAAMQRAREVAGLNLTAGEPTALELGASDSQGSDIQFGNMITLPTGRIEFVPNSSSLPNTVQVTARRTGARNNPLGLLLGSFLGVPTADLIARSHATLEDRIVGFTPVVNVPVPVVPLAILLSDRRNDRQDTWDAAITRRQGGDSFGFDSDRTRVVSQADAIPELELVGGLPHATATTPKPNVAMLDLGDGYHLPTIASRIRQGLDPRDLRDLGGSLRLNSENRLNIEGSSELPRELADAFRDIRGQCRAWPVYSESVNPHQPGQRIEIVGFVAARVLQVRVTRDGRLAVRIQPCFLITRSAIAESANSNVPKNLYIRKLTITG